MIISEKKDFYKSIGIIQILYAAILLTITCLYLPNLNGKVVFPELLKGIITYALLIASGLGILFQKKSLFLCSFYVYTILILRRFDYLYLHITSEKVTVGIEVLRRAIFINSVFQIVCAAMLICVMLLLLKGKNLERFHISKKIALTHATAGLILYMVFFRL